MTRRALYLAVAVLVGAACGDRNPAAPAFLASANAAPRVTAMSRNLYVGADVDVVIAALASPDPSDDVPALMTAITTLQETDFPTRAAAIADEIARTRPQVVGLQEVVELDIDLTGLGLPVDIELDFLPVLQAMLAARGLNYTVAGDVTSTVAAPIPGISYIDHDVVLINPARVTVSGPVIEQIFTFNIGVVAPGVDIKRGWVQFDALIDGWPVRVVSTHLEAGPGAALEMLRFAQASELVGWVGAAPNVIMLGDWNDVPGSLMYGVVMGAGFTDAWAALRPGVTGFTCCHLANLSNLLPAFDQRIDYVFVRGVGGPSGGLQGQITITGDQPADRVSGPAHLIWPSDHAGVVATLLMP